MEQNKVKPKKTKKKGLFQLLSYRSDHFASPVHVTSRALSLVAVDLPGGFTIPPLSLDNFLLAVAQTLTLLVTVRIYLH